MSSPYLVFDIKKKQFLAYLAASDLQTLKFLLLYFPQFWRRFSSSENKNLLSCDGNDIFSLIIYRYNFSK